MRPASRPDARKKNLPRSHSTGTFPHIRESGEPAPLQAPQPPKRPPKPPTGTPVPGHWTHPALAPGGPQQDRDNHQAIAQRLNARLASSGAFPQRARHAHRAATALLDLFVLFGWPSALCRSLVQDDALWAAFLLPRAAPHFERDGVADMVQGQGVKLRPPVSGRLLASVVAALLELGEYARAQEVLDACPQAKDQRVVLKRLLTHPGDPLRRLQSSDAASAFERVLQDMLDKHQDHYGEHGPAIMALLAHWHPPAAPLPLDGILDGLAKQQVFIKLDPQGHGLLIASGDLTPEALDGLVAYVGLALLDPERTLSVPGVVCDALAQLGVVLSFQGRVVFHRQGGPAQIRRDIASLAPPRYRDVARFARQCATALVADDQYLALTLGLFRLCALMEDPERAGDGAFQQATRRAMLRYGVIHPRFLDHDPASGSLSLHAMDALLNGVHEIPSPESALQFITGITRCLALIRPQDPSPENTRAQAEWRQLRQRLLTRLVEAFAQLLDRCTDPLDPAWMALARWVWVTEATLCLLPPDEDRLLPQSEGAVHAPCLALFAVQNKALNRTLTLLCAPNLLEPTRAMPDALVTVQELFWLCGTATRLAVLRHLPLPGLLLSMPPLFDLDLFFLKTPELPLDALANQFVHLLPYIESHMRLEDMSDTLHRLLGAANVDALIGILRHRPQGHRWAYYLFRTFREHLEESPTVLRPRGLPALLAWCGHVVLVSMAQGNHDPWASWLCFLSECANRENSHEPQEPLSVDDWLILGHYLPLSPDQDIARLQLKALSGDLLSAQAHAYLLLGWLRRRFAEVVSAPSREQAVPVVPSWLFKAVAEAAKAVTRYWSKAEKDAFRNELKPMSTQYAPLRKKHP